MAHPLTYTITAIDTNGVAVQCFDINSTVHLNSIAIVTLKHTPTAQIVFQHPMPGSPIHFFPHLQQHHHVPSPIAPPTPSQAPTPSSSTQENVSIPFEDTAQTLDEGTWRKVKTAPSPAASSSSEPKTPWTNVITKPAILNRTTLKYKPIAGTPADYTCFSSNFPQKNRNLMAFNIPEPVLKSKSWVLAFPYAIMYEMLRRLVGLVNLSFIEHKWKRFHPDETSDNDVNAMRIDYPEEAKWFMVFFHFTRCPRSVKDIHTCIRFNRWFADDEHGCDDGCRYKHICAICGNTSHGAFERDAKGEFICDYTYAITTQRKAIADAGHDITALAIELGRINKEHRKKRK